MKIKIIKFNNFNKTPFRAHYNDAGADVYSLEEYVLKPHTTVKLPLGFGLEIPDGFMGYITPRTSMASKGIIAHISPIDSGYRGEIHAIITNTTNNEYIINKDDRIAQLVIQPICICDFVDILGEERNMGAFGSTNKLK